MSPGWQIAVERQGNEAEPVVVIDNFVADPARLVDDAGFLHFDKRGGHYPGIRAIVPPALARPPVDALTAIIAEVFGLGVPAIVDAFYSIVTTPPSALTLIQRLPHFDGVEPGRLALLHYLSTDERGGTAFYRHRTTGFETVTTSRLDPYRATLANDLRREGPPPPGYIAGDTPLFERVASYAGRYNRAILYRSHTLHCADLPDGMDFAASPYDGRLTVNTFLAAGPPPTVAF